MDSPRSAFFSFKKEKKTFLLTFFLMCSKKLHQNDKLVHDCIESWETWDGLRAFPWREFGILLEELLPFAA